MSGGVQVSSSVDASRVLQAIHLAGLSSSRALGTVVKSAAYHTAVFAQRETPFVEIETIDQELDEVVEVPSSAYAKKAGLSGLPWTKGMMIALQRTNPNSPFSLATSNRWPLAYAGGLKGAERWRFFVDAAERMKSARHSSTHFLQAGWKGVRQLMLRNGFRAGADDGGVIDVDATVSDDEGNGLDVTKLAAVSQGGAVDAVWVKIENLIGTDRAYPKLAEQHNEALFEHALPALERGLERQVQSMKAHYLPKVGRELEEEWNKL